MCFRFDRRGCRLDNARTSRIRVRGPVVIFLLIARTASFVLLAFTIRAGWTAIQGDPWWPALLLAFITVVLWFLAGVATRRAKRLEEDYLVGALARTIDRSPELRSAVDHAFATRAMFASSVVRPRPPSNGRALYQFAVLMVELASIFGGFVLIVVGAFVAASGDWSWIAWGIGLSLLGLPMMHARRTAFTRGPLRDLAAWVLAANHAMVPEDLRRSLWAVAQNSVSTSDVPRDSLEHAEGQYQDLVRAWAIDQPTY